MATKKASTTPAKKTAAKTAEPAKPAAKKAPAKKPEAKQEPEAATANKLPGKRKPPTLQEISALAHRYWEESGHRHGHDAENWLRAERELKA